MILNQENRQPYDHLWWSAITVKISIYCKPYIQQMRIESIVCPEYIEEKLQVKHGVQCYEAEQVLLNRPRIRFAESGHIDILTGLKPR